MSNRELFGISSRMRFGAWLAIKAPMHGELRQRPFCLHVARLAKLKIPGFSFPELAAARCLTPHKLSAYALLILRKQGSPKCSMGKELEKVRLRSLRLLRSSPLDVISRHC